MTPAKLVLDSDLFLKHVAQEGSVERPSLLRILLGTGFCYTTVFQVVEMFSYCATGREVKVIEDALSGVKILGLNARTGKNIGAIARRAPDTIGDLELLAAGLCVESRLPLVTGRSRRYRGIRGLRLIPTRPLERMRGEAGVREMLARFR
ncbi:MAG: hypothetical protein WD295_06600 [Bacteroidota bacterium]